MTNDEWPYEDIIEHPHHVSKRHTPMTMWNRAAQFAPFAALTGYDDALQETAVNTQERYDQDVTDDEEVYEP